jgi:hypothetical protein
MSIINPWSLQLCKKQAEKLHRQLVGDENVTVSQSKFFFRSKFLFVLYTDQISNSMSYDIAITIN